MFDMFNLLDLIRYDINMLFRIMEATMSFKFCFMTVSVFNMAFPTNLHFTKKKIFKFTKSNVGMRSNNVNKY